jgi:lipoprotein NlpI
MRSVILLALFALLAPTPVLIAAELEESPLSPEARMKIDEEAKSVIETETEALKITPRGIESLSRRGDAYFQLAEFRKAVADYDQMVVIDPQQDASHWRRGIALFYTGEYEKAAAQFERYHSFDNVDRENGIWRYLCQVKSSGVEEARKGLLKYEKDDREPFPDVFKLFAGTISPSEIDQRIADAKISDEQREMRRFYADLYTGLNHAVEGRDAEATTALRKAVANTWAPKASYGPRWMWHVGRVHFDLLRKAEKPAEEKGTTATTKESLNHG